MPTSRQAALRTERADVQTQRAEPKPLSPSEPLKFATQKASSNLQRDQLHAEEETQATPNKYGRKDASMS